MTTAIANRQRLRNRGRLLAQATIAWNAVEGVVAIAAGISAGSLALVGFGLDSFVEVFAGGVVLWHLCSTGGEREDSAHRLIAVSFFALAAYVVAEAARDLLVGHEATESAVGIGLAAVSLVDLVGGLEPMAALDSAAVQGVGVVVALAGIAATVATQHAMGDSWRVGVDPTEHTDLVMTGPFRTVRNPIFTAMAVTAIGLALMVPNVIALVGLATLAVALELQVRLVEEPNLQATHGHAYTNYAATVGRFLPTLGRRNPTPAQTLHDKRRPRPPRSRY